VAVRISADLGDLAGLVAAHDVAVDDVTGVAAELAAVVGSLPRGSIDGTSVRVDAAAGEAEALVSRLRRERESMRTTRSEVEGVHRRFLEALDGGAAPSRPSAWAALLGFGGVRGGGSSSVLMLLDGLSAGGRSTGGRAAELRDLGGQDPSLVARWFAGRSPSELRRLALRHPELVGPLDGAPFSLRYQANRLLVRRALRDLRWLERLDGVTIDRTRRARMLRRLADPSRQLLFFDPSGLGRAVEVHGDLERAANVAILVPGMSNHLGTFEGLSRDARRLAATAEGYSGSITIAWLGYEPPQSPGSVLQVPDVARTAIADAAAADLARLVLGLRGLTSARVVVIGHSYGSLVTGRAVTRERMHPDDVVFLGSPGVGVDDADDLGLPPDTDVYAARAPFDGVGYLQHFGTDPSDPGFGARRIDTTDDDSYVWWHSSYYRRRSESLENLARIAGNAESEVTIDHAGPLERAHAEVDEVIDGGQRLLDGMHRQADRVIDVAEPLEPLVPVAGALDGVQAAGRLAHDAGDLVVDVSQRLADAAADTGRDVVDRGDRLLDDLWEGAGSFLP
jgi:hypothetical protein